MKKFIFALALIALMSGPVFAADEALVSDPNGVRVSGAVTDDASMNTTNLRVDPTSMRLKVDSLVTSSVLPSGAATESTLSSLNGKVTACNTGSVTVATSALPSGAATETTLGSILTASNVSSVGFDTVFDADADNSAQSIKASAGSLVSLTVDNANYGAKIFIQLFDLAVGSVTVGVTAPKYVIPVPAGAMFDDRLIPPMKFTTAITYAITSTATGAGVPGATIALSAGYK